MRACGHLRAAPDWKALDMSMLMSVIAVGFPPCSRRSAAKAVNVCALRPGVANSRRRASGIGIVEQGQVPLAAPGTGLLDADPGHRGMVFLRPRLGDVVLEHPPDAVIRHPDQSGHVRHRHRLAQRDHERFHDQRKARAGARPRHRNLAGLAARRARHARQPGVDVGLELEEVQVLPTAIDAVMDRLVDRPTRWAWQAVGLALDLEVDGAFELAEVERGHRPRRGQAQRLCVKRCSIGLGCCRPTTDQAAAFHTDRDCAPFGLSRPSFRGRDTE